MTSSEIRRRFLEYFERHGHAVRPSSGLVPGDDPTLLFTNAGMVQFKSVFLGEERVPFRRAATSQKCLRVSGKHNDLEEVGVTSRHHTFFEMLGNFSFGDYFKRDAIRFAWELFTEEFGLPKDRLWATVHYTDDEAAALWQEIAGLPPERVFRLGDKDNFWQMGETGPCGPCSEIHYDLRTEGRGTDVSQAEFEALGEAGEFLELWNLVFMQYDRSADGTLNPLPAPSIDTGAGLERLSAALQGVDSNYRTDLFMALIDRAVEVVGEPYIYATDQGVSYRVLADHARAVAFLLADGVYPTNEGRGYVLRRILRRAVRHAWLLGRREPTLVHVVDRVADVMGDHYPELIQRRDHLLRATRDEEQRFLDTIDSGMDRFDELAPRLSNGDWQEIERGTRSRPMVSGEDAFRLYDTFGFPIDLTEIIARERGYGVDGEGFEAALEQQRERSRQDRRSQGLEAGDALSTGWDVLDESADQEFVGYAAFETETEVVALRREDGRVALQLRQNPFYAESGGQISDRGHVEGDGWSVQVDDVRKVGGRTAVIGNVDGHVPEAAGPLPVRAQVYPDRRDTMRNHTATHLLHAALRSVLGEHVLQRGSLVAPDRLRFDFSHPRPMTPDEVRAVEERVNQAILQDTDVVTEEKPYAEAMRLGAMALFGEKYGDVVRVVMVPGVSVELCGGTHVRHTGDIGLFRITTETGVAAGIRRVEAVTGSTAYRRAVAREDLLNQAAAAVKTTPDTLLRRLEQLLDENRELRRQLERSRQAGSGDVVSQLLGEAEAVDGARVIARELEVGGGDELRSLGDRLRDRLGSGAAVIAGRQEDRVSLVAVVTDDLITRGVRADVLVREVAKLTGGSGGGRPHMGQGGVGDAARLQDALGRTTGLVRAALAAKDAG
ncbi:MAG TPA: alanine--tRNA ligase [Longimicrobiales bacterium]|nr:alanine--tRNA ligase [Longimicrobiales bacterium]